MSVIHDATTSRALFTSAAPAAVSEYAPPTLVAKPSATRRLNVGSRIWGGTRRSSAMSSRWAAPVAAAYR